MFPGAGAGGGGEAESLIAWLLTSLTLTPLTPSSPVSGSQSGSCISGITVAEVLSPMSGTRYTIITITTVTLSLRLGLDLSHRKVCLGQLEQPAAGQLQLEQPDTIAKFCSRRRPPARRTVTSAVLVLSPLCLPPGPRSSQCTLALLGLLSSAHNL